ncbi:OmpP1/FadL family transporter [Thiocapsa bogorovii]|uniref:OmpP1/FadL family transporter n=1 Tax=Thiocapsa bogorovii TaxID=521689 RepID=UPI001E5267E9|nr:porin [Thiocapsa bogorovii]UHD17165.1 outer membrane protein transport protein [Thiocapsa bogorovii]
MNQQIARAIATAIAAGACVASAQSFAAGFSLPEVSTAGIGLANALVANPEETGAFAYNPAAMGFHDGSSVALGGILIGPNFSVRTDSGQHDSQGADWTAAPMIQAALRVNEDWRIGLGITAPFGLETRWEDGTFPALSGTVRIPVPPPLDPNVPRGQPTASKLEILDFSPTVAYRVNDNLSLSGGLDIYWVKNAQLDSTAGRLSGDGADVGFNLSALYRYEAWSFGAAFRSSATVGLEGDYRPLSRTLVAIGRLPPAQSAEVDVDLPWRLQLGVRYAVTEALAVEFDWTRTGWSSFSKLEVEGTGTGETIFTDTNDWNDSNAYRLGVTYQIRPDTQLRFGYSYDETGQEDAHFSARVPDNDRHLFGIGVAHLFGDGLSIELGYMYVKANDRTINSSTPYRGGGVNGTDAIDGDYEMDAHLIGLEIVKVF